MVAVRALLFSTESRPAPTNKKTKSILSNYTNYCLWPLTVDINGDFTTSTDKFGGFIKSLTLVASRVNFTISVEDTEVGVPFEVASTALLVGINSGAIL